MARKRVRGSPFLPSLEIVRSFPGSCGPCSGKHTITLWNFKVFLKLWKYAKFTLSEYCSKYLGIPRKRTAWEYLQVRLSMFRTPWRFISSASNISNQPGTPNKFLCPHTFFKYQCWSMPLIKYKRRSIQPGTLSNRWWDNLTPRTIWHLGQFDTDHARRTIWHLGLFDT